MYYIYIHVYYVYIIYTSFSLSSTSFKLPAVSKPFASQYRVISSCRTTVRWEIHCLNRCTMSIGYQCQRWKLRSIKFTWIIARVAQTSDKSKSRLKIQLSKEISPTTVTLKIEQVTSFIYSAWETTAKLSTSGSRDAHWLIPYGFK